MNKLEFAGSREEFFKGARKWGCGGGRLCRGAQRLYHLRNGSGEGEGSRGRDFENVYGVGKCFGEKVNGLDVLDTCREK